jgi:hypothetical protein
VVIPEDRDGHIDLGALEVRLRRVTRPPLKIGSFSAASNVTGIVTDTHAISDLLHRHGALSFWTSPRPRRTSRSTCTAGPPVPAQLQGRGVPLAAQVRRRAGTPGVLVVRRELLRNRVPTVPGGGTVDYVNPNRSPTTSPTPRTARRAGTQAIVESNPGRPGFPAEGGRRGRDDPARTRSTSCAGPCRRGAKKPNLQVTGNASAERLSILSFGKYAAPGGQLPAPNTSVVSLLNDLFGIQAARRLLLRRAVRPPGCWASTSSARTGSSSRSLDGCEGIKARLVRVSIHTTSSHRRSSSTSWPRWTSWRRTAGRCSRSTGSTRTPGCGGTAAAWSSPRCG